MRHTLRIVLLMSTSWAAPAHAGTNWYLAQIAGLQFETANTSSDWLAVGEGLEMIGHVTCFGQTLAPHDRPDTHEYTFRISGLTVVERFFDAPTQLVWAAFADNARLQIFEDDRATGTPAEFGVYAVFTALNGIFTTCLSLRYELGIPIAGNERDAAALHGAAVIAVVLTCAASLPLVWLIGPWLAAETEMPLLVSALWLLPYTLWRAVSFPWAEVPPVVWWALFWTIVPTTLYAFLAWNWAMGQVGAIAATNMFYLMPLASAVAAWTLLGEPITFGQVIGGVVIVVGIVLLRWEALVTTGFIRLPENWPRLPWKR